MLNPDFIPPVFAVIAIVASWGALGILVILDRRAR